VIAGEWWDLRKGQMGSVINVDWKKMEFKAEDKIKEY